MNTQDYRLAPNGQGPLAAEYADKPHRLVYDLANEVDNLNTVLDLERKEARNNYTQVLNKLRLVERSLADAREALASETAKQDAVAPPTNAEALYIAAFLNELSDRFGNDGCNDMYIPNTPENAELVKAAQLHLHAQNEGAFDSDAEAAEVNTQKVGKGKPKISTDNLTVIEYLIDRFIRGNGIKRRNLPNTQDW